MRRYLNLWASRKTTLIGLSLFYYWMAGPLPAEARGFLRTRMTESPLRNILGMYRSLFTGFDFFLPEKKEYRFKRMRH